MIDMLLYNIILAIRNLQRQKFYSAINILGFALGIAVFFYIAVYILDQYAYDRWVEKSERIYRLEKGEWAATGTAFGPFLLREFPEVENMARISSGRRGILLQHGDVSFPRNHVLFADSTVFDIFSFSFLEGNPATALTEPRSIVLTESLAEKIFGTTSHVIGRTLRIADRMPVRVTGLIEDILHFHLPGNALIPFHLLAEFYPEDDDFLYQWGSWNYSTFLLMTPGADMAHFETKINDAIFKEMQEAFGIETERDFFVRPLQDIYFANDIRHEPPVLHGSKQNVGMFLAVSLFILLIAVVNFINLSTARSSLRAKEVGIRRLLGSHRSSLIMQFLTESVVITAFSVLLALVILETGLPWFNQFAETSFRLGDMEFYNIVFLLALSSLVVGLFSGIYPALYLTSFIPVKVLKGETTRGQKGAFFRKALIVFQFVISVSLITATLVINDQLQYMQKEESGLDMDNTLVLNLNQHILPRWETFSNQLSAHPDVVATSLSAQLPGTVTWQESADVNDLGAQQYTLMPVNAEYPAMMGVDLLAGRLFSREYQSEERVAVLLNEQAVGYFGYEGRYEDIVNQPFTNSFQVVGIVRDFHYNSLHNPIGPLVILWDDARLNFAHVKMSGNNTAGVISHIETVWSEFSPSFPFEYQFLTDVYMAAYEKDRQLSQIFMIFSGFAIMIACLGLFGLASFMAERRLREMAVRKVMGAGMKDIVMLMLKDFLKLVALAFVIATPLTWHYLQEWIHTFPYHTHITVVPFLISLAFALAITIITVSYHAIRVSNVSPGMVLKHE